MEDFLSGLRRRRRPAQPVDAPEIAPPAASLPARAQEGIAHYERGDLDAAGQALEQALDLEPGCAAAHYHVGLIALQRGDAEEALDRFRLAIHFSPSLAAAHRELGRALQRLGDLGAAEEACARACALDPADAMNHFAAAGVSKAVGNLDEAVVRYQAAVERRADFAGALCNLGYVLHQLGRGEQALPYLDRALAIEPGFVEVIHNQGLVFLDHGNPERALECFLRALTIRPDEPAIGAAQAHALRDLGRLDEAVQAYDAVLARHADFSDAVANRGQTLLAAGDFARGWAEYERRFEASGAAARSFPFPRWKGDPLQGGALLVHAEQGLGDEIMFASCLPETIERVPHCVIECNPRLAALFQRSFPSARVHGGLKGEPQDWLGRYPDIACQIPVGSLPSLLRGSAAAFPVRTGYLKADLQRVAAWRSRLSGLGDGFKIGISWRGGTHKTRMRLRSVPPDAWCPLLRLPQAQFVSLQYGASGPALAEFRQRCGVEVADWPEAVADLDECAALICALDLVISVDNTTVHLAGALGKPVWVLLSYAPEWRYLAAGERMPWYPSARLFRQGAPGSWETVIDAVAGALALAQARGGPGKVFGPDPLC